MFPSLKFNMSDITASLGINQLGRLERNLHWRKRLWDEYVRAFGDLPFDLPHLPNAPHRHARHLFVVRLRLSDLRIGRRDVVRALKAENVGTGIHYPAIHRHDVFRRMLGVGKGSFPAAEWLSDRVLSLPFGPSMSPKDAADVIAAVRKVVQFYRVHRTQVGFGLINRARGAPSAE